MSNPDDFYRNNPEYRDLEPPEVFAWIFMVYLEIRSMSADRVTWQDIDSWQTVMRERLSLYEVRLIRQMQSWADDECERMKNG